MAPNAAERELRVSGDPAKKPSLEPWRIIIARRDGQPTGYALVRRDGKWEAGVPAGTATVREFRALDSASGQAIWRELVSLDLITSVVTPLLEIDDPLLTWLEDIRAAHPAFQDCEHVRIVGLPAALTARRYTVPLTVRIAVHDPLLVDNAGVWELDGGPDGAQVRRLSGPEYQAEADLSIGIDDLGSVYFGGVTATSLADAGVITEHTFGSVQLVSRAFRSDRAPAAGPGF
jgi:predicted acetyltransferase